MKAITRRLGLKCNRCGNKDRMYFAKTKCQCNTGVYCRKCVSLGKLSCCEEIPVNSLVFNRETPELALSYPLTKLQKEGADFLVKSYRQQRSSLLVAVCGAGKTEMIYKVIMEALNDNKNVCIAIPRVEVVKEIASRVKKDLQVNVTALYGGSKDPKEATLFVATCNQLLKYPKVFDLIILDEADAFPYSTSKELKYGLKNALTDKGILVTMTATPSFVEKLLNYRKHRIRSRYHRFKIVEPVIEVHANQMAYLDNYVERAKFSIVYVDSIRMLNQLEDKYSQKFLYLSSKSINKDETLKRFKKKESKVLFSTTILERGLTFEGLNVLVVHAENKVFTISTMIQIAGRVGRKMSNPYGEVIFLCHKLMIKHVIAKSIIKVDNIISKLRGDIY